jgi:hypothetical protein
MARVGVKYADLEKAAGDDTARAASAQRDEGHFSQVIENTDGFYAKPSKPKSLKNNDKTDNHSVGASGKNRWGHKRRLVPAVAGSGQ